jgi:hypothetical protein
MVMRSGKARRGVDMKRMLTLIAAVALGALVLGIFSAAGTMPKEAQAASKKKYTAIAVTPSVIGWSYADGYTKNEAKRKALHICRTEAPKHSGYTGDCQGASWVKNGYVALAFEKTIEQPYANLQWGSGWSFHRSDAKREARLECYYNADESCQIAIWRRTPFYSDRGYIDGGNW